MSRGQLIHHGRYHTRGQVLIALIVPITKDMLPSFRIIAYYHLTDNEVESDSVWVDVKDTCMGSVRLTSLFKKSKTNNEKKKDKQKVKKLVLYFWNTFLCVFHQEQNCSSPSFITLPFIFSWSWNLRELLRPTSRAGCLVWRSPEIQRPWWDW